MANYGKSCVDSHFGMRPKEGLRYGQSTDKQKYFIPMEVTPEIIKAFNINGEEVQWTKIGNKSVRVIMVPATEEQYYAYMRPLWREDKQNQRASKQEDEGK